MPEKHCRNCSHSRNVEESVTEDFELVPELNECSNANVIIKFMERYNWDPSLLAKKCSHYKPKPVGKCSNCGHYIATPLYQWKLFSESLYGKVPVCSAGCKKELDKKVNKYLKEDDKSIE